MKKFSSNKSSLLLTEAALSLLILSAMVTAFMSTPQTAHAQTQSCTNVSQNYAYSNIWPSVGPEFLKEISQELTATTRHTIGTQQIYLQLTSKGICNLATLVQKQYKVINPAQAYQFEKHMLTTVQSQLMGSVIPGVPQGLTWITSQTNPTLIDNWISSAIITHPNNILENNHTSSTLIPSFRNTDYENALNVFCNTFQHDITTYLYSSATPAHLQTMALDLRSGSGNSVSALALGLGAGTNPQIISPALFEKEELQKAKQLIDDRPSTITPCPGSESLAKAKPALDNFVTHELPILSIADIDSFFSQAALFNPANQ